MSIFELKERSRPVIQFISCTTGIYHKLLPLKQRDRLRSCHDFQAVNVMPQKGLIALRMLAALEESNTNQIFELKRPPKKLVL